MLSTPLGKLNALIECFYYCHSDIAVICKVLNCKLFPLVTYSGGVEVRYVVLPFLWMTGRLAVVGRMVKRGG